MGTALKSEDEKVIRLNISLAPSVLVRLDRMAGDMEMTRSAMITHLVTGKVVLVEDSVFVKGREAFWDKVADRQDDGGLEVTEEVKELVRKARKKVKR